MCSYAQRFLERPHSHWTIFNRIIKKLRNKELIKLTAVSIIHNILENVMSNPSILAFQVTCQSGIPKSIVYKTKEKSITHIKQTLFFEYWNEVSKNVKFLTLLCQLIFLI